MFNIEQNYSVWLSQERNIIAIESGEEKQNVKISKHCQTYILYYIYSYEVWDFLEPKEVHLIPLC